MRIRPARLTSFDTDALHKRLSVMWAACAAKRWQPFRFRPACERPRPRHAEPNRRTKALNQVLQRSLEFDPIPQRKIEDFQLSRQAEN
jgi:hypothetical protein